MSRPKKNKRRYKITENKKEIQKIFKESYSKTDVCKKLNIPLNGSGYRLIKYLIDDFKIDISHFDGGKHKRFKYPVVNKKCPVCGKIFKTSKGSPKEKQTCSYSCSNTFFRSGRANGQWKTDTYRTTCFRIHKKECVHCGEKKAVCVHHFDGDKTNNKIENLIPLCMNHHLYVHSNFEERKDVMKSIEKFRNKI